LVAVAVDLAAVAVLAGFALQPVLLFQKVQLTPLL
jgi:hypothetical protein